MTTLSILFVGLLLGMQHATEADHLAAVASLATQQTSLGRTLRLGVAWGLGHTATLMLFAGAVLVLGQVVSPGVERGLETAVGVMLIGLGADVLRRLVRDQVHFHVQHCAPGTRQAQAHSHSCVTLADPADRHEHAVRLPLRALAVGTMHGLAGSAALVVLSAQAAPSLTLGIGYIALFAAGSIVGMALLSVAIAVPLRWSAARLTPVHRWLTGLVGAVSCSLGLSVIWQSGLLRAWLFA